ncbi:hypothetical protein LCGC14_1597020 [marine sediment metagenome]|uniref:Uncharacterized protein n=1 Tax=marine sediment metagenome TaxID=412755 RepID=A0A0F9ICP3_9ZZZZ
MFNKLKESDPAVKLICGLVTVLSVIWVGFYISSLGTNWSTIPSYITLIIIFLAGGVSVLSAFEDLGLM